MLPTTDLRMQTMQSEIPAQVLLHVLAGSRRAWIEVAAMLAPEFRVVSIDTPGFGEANQIAGYSVAEMARQFAETIASLHLERFVLVGHSMSAKVAAVLAGQKLPGLKKLVLLAPSPPGPEPIAPEARAQMLAQTGSLRVDAESYIRTNSALPMPPKVFERAVEDRMRANPNAWRAWLESGSREDDRAHVQNITLPTLVIAAEKDTSLGPEVQQRLTLPHFPLARMETIRSSGHLVPMEAPEKLAPLLRDFAVF